MRRFTNIFVLMLVATVVGVAAATHAFAKDYITSVFLMLDNGSPITTEQTIRLSLWSDGRERSGDITAGVINLAASNYAGYNTEVVLTPDSNGRLSVALGSLSNFPQIDPTNQYLQVEYKESAAAVSTYVTYTDTYIDTVAMDRFPLVENGPDIFDGIYTNDATTADIFMLDFDDDATGTIDLQFGNGVSPSTISVNTTTGNFSLNEDLDFGSPSGVQTLTFGDGTNADALTFAANSALNASSADVALDGIINNTFTLDENNSGGDVVLQFGNSGTDGSLTWDDSANFFVLGSDTTPGGDRNNLSMEIETASTLPGGAGGLGSSGEGRLVILNTTDTTAPGCTVSPNCSSGTYIWDGGAWISLVGSATSTNLTKVVTVGSTGSDYTTIATAAAYLQNRSGGIMLLSAETHAVTTAVNLTNTTLVGKDASRTTIQISGAGQFDTFDTVFEHLTLDVNSVTDTMAIDIQSGASSLIFNYVEADIQDSGDSLIDSNAGTAPTVIMKLIKSNQSGTLGKILDTKAASNLNVSSVIFVDSRSNDDPLQLSDWGVTVAGGGSVLTDGIITSVPARTIYVSPNMNLQGAIDSLESASNGGLITLLPGTHTITATLTIEDDDIHIAGYGDSSIISASGITGGTTVGAIQVGSADGTTPVNGVVLKDFKLEVTGVGASDIHGIRGTGGSDNRVDNVTVQKVSGASGSGGGGRMGIQFIDGASTNLIRPVIINSRVLGTSGSSAYFTDGIHVTADGSISGIFGNGNRVENALLDGNFVDYVGETAYVFNGANDSSLFNNRASNMGAGGGSAYGIYIGNATNVNMTANVFNGSLSANAIAIGVESFNIGSLSETTDSLFNNNIIRGSGSGFAIGFQIGNANNTGVHRNQFQNNQIYGASNVTTTAVIVRGNADQNNFSNNNITGNGNSWDTGIDLQSSTQQENLVRGNRFSNTTTTITDSATSTLFGLGAIIDTTTPTVNDDSGDGYGLGDIWIDTSADDAYILLDDTVASAVWTQIDGGGGGGTNTIDDAYNNFAATAALITIDDNGNGANNGLEFLIPNNQLLNTVEGAIVIDANETTDTFPIFTIQNAGTGYSFLVDEGDVVFDNNLIVGGSTSRTETLAGVFALDGDDMFIADSLGVEGAIYTDSTATKYEWLDIAGGVRASATLGTVNSGRSPVIRFDGTDNSRVRYSFPVPDDWVSGTDIEIEVFWSPSDATAGNVYYTFNYDAYAITEIISGTNTLSSTEATPGTSLELGSFIFTLANANLAADDMINIRLSRIPGNGADTYAGDANIHMLRINYIGKKLL